MDSDDHGWLHRHHSFCNAYTLGATLYDKWCNICIRQTIQFHHLHHHQGFQFQYPCYRFSLDNPWILLRFQSLLKSHFCHPLGISFCGYSLNLGPNCLQSRRDRFFESFQGLHRWHLALIQFEYWFLSWSWTIHC